MWSVNSDTWKDVFTQGGYRWVNRVAHHTGMTPANQRTRKSVLRRRAIAKQAVASRQYLAAQRNINLLLTGSSHDSN